MDQYHNIGISSAIIAFVDIVNSSKYSSVLGYKEYAERIITFQQEFKLLGNRYFPPLRPEEKRYKYLNIDSRGDEGIIFILDPTEDQADFILDLIAFIFHLKGRLKLINFDQYTDEAAPMTLGIAAGIHIGKVAYATRKEEETQHVNISQLEGFSINYTKRLETNARLGKYSNIIVSSDIFKFLKGFPIFMSPIVASLKGIEDQAEIFEIIGCYLENMKIDKEDPKDQKLHSMLEKCYMNPNVISEHWIRHLCISYWASLAKSSIVIGNKQKYLKKQIKFSWEDINEDDPILLYIRSRDAKDNSNHISQLRYLKKINENFPYFLYARIKMIEAQWEISKLKNKSKEKIIAQDYAKEFLDKFDYYLNNEEKKLFRKIISG